MRPGDYYAKATNTAGTEVLTYHDFTVRIFSLFLIMKVCKNKNDTVLFNNICTYLRVNEVLFFFIFF